MTEALRQDACKQPEHHDENEYGMKTNTALKDKITEPEPEPEAEQQAAVSAVPGPAEAEISPAGVSLATRITRFLELIGFTWGCPS